MNVRSVLIVMIAAPLASTALAQGYQGPGPQAQRPAPTAAPAAPATPETPAPPAQPAAVTGMPTVPSHNCVAPQYPGKSAPDAKIKVFNASYKEYGECIRKYVDNARTLANAAISSGNDAVTEYNKYTEDVKKQLDADK
jgi:hypothetical protein